MAVGSVLLSRKLKPLDNKYCTYMCMCIVLRHIDLCADTLSIIVWRNPIRAKLNTALASKPLAYFEAQLKAYIKQKAPIKRTPKDIQCAQLASYKVSHRIVRARKPHTIAENLLLPAAIDMVTTFGAKDVAKQVQTIPLSNSSISRKIQGFSDDLHQQLKSSMTGKLFALQVDEATDSSQDCLLMGSLLHPQGGFGIKRTQWGFAWGAQ